MKHALAVALFACTLTGWAPPAGAKRVPDSSFLENDQRTALTGKTLAIALHPASQHQRGGDGSLGTWVVGGTLLLDSVLERQGEEFTEKSPIEDPAIAARSALAEVFRDAYGMVPQAPDTTVSETARTKKLAETHPASDYVLSVRTLVSRHQELFFGEKGLVTLSMEVQIVNVSTRSVIAYIRCDDNSANPDDAPTMTALEADGARRLQNVLAYLAGSCARKFAYSRMYVPEDKLTALPKPGTDPYTWVPPTVVGATGRRN